MHVAAKEQSDRAEDIVPERHRCASACVQTHPHYTSTSTKRTRRKQSLTTGQDTSAPHKNLMGPKIPVRVEIHHQKDSM